MDNLEFDNHEGVHDDCRICDMILAKRMEDMGRTPQWDPNYKYPDERK